MSATETDTPNAPPPQNSPNPDRRKRIKRGCCCGCGGCSSIIVLLIVAVFTILQRAPRTFLTITNPIPPPPLPYQLGGGLEGFESPYIGHTGSWDGKGGGWGSSKLTDMDIEKGMGLRWTFMCVYWSAMEPDGPVDLSREIPPAWRELDNFVIEAHRRGLNILMQAPVVGGNAGGPPKWAGRREPGKSAPHNMEALAEFGRKLVERYRPGGRLAEREGWGKTYGVRAWELDNEPATYFTNWKGQAADYAEFVARAAERMKKADPLAVITGPAIAAGDGKNPWIEETLNAEAASGSPELRRSGKRWSAGPYLDVVTFHIYEGLDTAFSGKDRTVERVFSEVRDVFERSEQRSPGFTYPRKTEYWHTEGNYDFIGAMSAERRAAWRWQFFSRSFAAGIRKVVVMDASGPEQIAVKTWVQTLPDPFPMQPANDRATTVTGHATIFVHEDRAGTHKGRIWVAWANAGTGDAEIEIPLHEKHVVLSTTDGRTQDAVITNGRTRVKLTGDSKIAQPVMVIDRP